MPASYGPLPGANQAVDPSGGPTFKVGDPVGGPIGGALENIASMLKGNTPWPRTYAQPTTPMAPPMKPQVGTGASLPALDRLPGLQGLMDMLRNPGGTIGNAIAQPWREALSGQEAPTALSGSARLMPQPEAPNLFSLNQPAAGSATATGAGGEWAGISATAPTRPPTAAPSSNELPPEASTPGNAGGFPAARAELLPEAFAPSAQPAAIAAARAGVPTAPVKPAEAGVSGGIQGAISAAIAADVEIQKRLATIEEAKQALAVERQNLQKAVSIAELTGEYEGKETLIAQLRKRLVTVEEKMADLEAERIRGILAAANRGLDIQEKEGKRKHLRETAGMMGYAPPGIFAA